jgi:Cft2 family RNA processing exonuclease
MSPHVQHCAGHHDCRGLEGSGSPQRTDDHLVSERDGDGWSRRQASSAHADADELLDWMRAMPGKPRTVFVTHGEPGSSDALRQRIERELHWQAVVPEHGASHDLALGGAA